MKQGRVRSFSMTIGESPIRVFALAGVLALSSHIAFAQDETRVREGLGVWKDAACDYCHGAFADGRGAGDAPAGSNLRRTDLDRDLLIETISCGRPETAMPYFLEGAYTEVPCYGLPLGQPQADRGGAISPEDIEKLVDYLLARIVGKGRVTREECGYYYEDPDHPLCASYRP